MSDKTVFYLIGSRKDFRFVKAASHIPEGEVYRKLSEMRALGYLTFVRPSGCVIKQASDFDNEESREKYYQHLMNEYFNEN